MIINKKINFQIGITESKYLYSTNPDAAILEVLTNMYAKRCHKSCFIVKFINIVKRSPLVSNPYRSGGECSVSVYANVEAVVFDTHEVIPDSEVIEIMDDGTIVLMSETTVTHLSPNPSLGFVKVGMKLPIRVVEASYEPRQKKVSIQGLPFIPVRTSHDSIQVHGVAFTAGELKDLESIQNNITEVREKINSKVRKVWEDIMRPTIKESKLPGGYKLVDIDSIPVGKSITIMRPDSLIPTVQCLYKDFTSTSTSKVSGINVLKSYLQHTLKYYKTMYELSEHYTVDASTKNIWQLYIANKFS